jgi:HEAT repeat protein
MPTPPIPTMAGMERRPRRLRGRDSYSFRLALLALLNALPNEETAEEIIELLPISDPGHLLHDISKVSHEKIPKDFKVLFYKKTLMEPSRERYVRLNEFTAANLLKDTGGKEAGDALSEVLLKSKNPMARNAAAKALGSIKGYDALPILIKAAREKKTSVSGLAEAMGRINNPKALIVLEDMEGSEKLSEMDRLWLAAALARLGKDYEKNAEILRNSLPASYEPMAFLNDTETLNILIENIKSGPIHGQAIQTLEAIGSREALTALGRLLEQDKISSPYRYRETATAAARMADRLEVGSRDYYNDVATVSKTVLDWFVIHQRVQPRPEGRSSFKVVERHSALARKLWIALIPVLERIAKESKSTVGFHGKYKIVKFYNVRSKAAQILTEKTGQQCSFIDVDGRSHPGGWQPSQE